MSGHSKWAGIKHKKAQVDAKRGQLFTKLIKEISIAAREGGGNAETNSRLRVAIAKAKESNMPKESIERAIKRGTGELPGMTLEEVLYEGYGPKGVAILIEALTDNKNRTTAEIRNILTKKGGSLAGTGQVSWLFNKKGYLLIDKGQIEEERLLSIVLDAGAEDMKTEQKTYEIITPPQDLEKLKELLKQNGIAWQTAEITMLPTSTIKLTGDDARSVLLLLEAIESHDDTQRVYANFDIPEEILEEVTAK